MTKRRTSQEIADTEAAILAYVYEYERQHGRMPTMSELTRDLNITRGTADWLTPRLITRGHMKPLSDGRALRNKATTRARLWQKAEAIQAQVRATEWKSKGE